MTNNETVQAAGKRIDDAKRLDKMRQSDLKRKQTALEKAVDLAKESSEELNAAKENMRQLLRK